MAFRLSLLQRGLILVSIPLAVQLGLIGSLAYLHELAEADAKKAAHALEVSDAVNQLVKDIYEVGSRAMDENSELIWEDPKYIVASEDLKKEIATLKNLVKDEPEHAAIVSDVERASMRAFALLQDGRDLYETHRWIRKSEPRRNVFRQLRHQVRLIVNDKLIGMARDEKQFANSSPQRQSAFREQVHALLIGGAAFNVLLTVLLAISFNRGIISRLEVMIDNSLRLAGGRALNPQMDGADEISSLDKVFHVMADELTEAARKERAIVENARDVICSLDSKGTFIAVSAAASKVFGFTPEELIGSKMVNLVVSEEQGSAHDQLKIVMLGEPEPPFETRLQRKDGRLIDVAWSTTWSQTEETIFCVAHDITERKEAERLRQEVVQMVSHDLKTPLASVRSFHEMLESGMFGELSARGKELLVIADRSTQRMLALVRDLVEIERMEAGMLELHKSDVEVAALFEQAENAVASMANQQGIKVEQDAAGLEIFADGDRIVQVLINLLTNAIKFSPSGETVRMTAESIPGFIEIKVIDAGRGVPEHMRNSIFERFKQVQISDAKDKGGSGLGLAICRALVELHGGSIRVESPGQGSAFAFQIPALSQVEAPDAVLESV